MKIRFRMIASLAAGMLLFGSCKKEEAQEENNENELITAVRLDMIEAGGADTLSYTWSDSDGPGGAEPVIDNIVLSPGTSYQVKLTLLDETKTPVDDITQEVKDEGGVHRLYYEPSSGTGITVDSLDQDSEGRPLGINSKWTTTDFGTGSIRIVLRHYPNAGKEASDPVNSSKSSTDADVAFSVLVTL